MYGPCSDRHNSLAQAKGNVYLFLRASFAALYIQDYVPNDKEEKSKNDEYEHQN